MSGQSIPEQLRKSLQRHVEEADLHEDEELTQLMGDSSKSAGEVTLKKLISGLGEVGLAFQNTLDARLRADVGTSPEAAGSSSNAYMIRLKPDVGVAIRRAHQLLMSELKHSYGHKRKILVYELVEGTDGDLSSYFAELAASLLQNQRMSATAVSVYIGPSQKMLNSLAVRVALGRCVNAACEYLQDNHNVPTDRNTYFNSVSPSALEKCKRAKFR